MQHIYNLSVAVEFNKQHYCSTVLCLWNRYWNFNGYIPVQTSCNDTR